ncbi:MAG: hypothetical protein JWM11_7969 [Planctomycetaceae bacterium]|nr:hypothetical protein [Planctomycetaceae bacterium]
MQRSGVGTSSRSTSVLNRSLPGYLVQVSIEAFAPILTGKRNWDSACTCKRESANWRIPTFHLDISNSTDKPINSADLVDCVNSVYEYQNPTSRTFGFTSNVAVRGLPTFTPVWGSSRIKL